MKEFLQHVVEWKVSSGLLFIGSVFLYLCFCLLLGQSQVETSMLWSLMLICLIGSLLQGVCFSNWVFQKMRYTLRLLLFCLLFLPTLSAIAIVFQWFPMEQTAWLVFCGIFFAVFVIMTIGFEIYFRITGRKYDGFLGQYRRDKEEKGE